MRHPKFAVALVFSLLMLSFGVEPRGGSLNDLVRTIQEELIDAGVDPGEPDGRMGPQTRRAIRQFQAARDIPATGFLDRSTQEALGVEVPEVTIASGTRIQVRLGDTLDSATARTGDQFSMIVTEAVGAEGGIPRGAAVSGVVRLVESARRPQKGGRLELDAVRIRSGAFDAPLQGHVTAVGEALEGEGSAREDAAKIGIGAGAGGVLGAILGGKKGAVAGVLIGAGGVFVATKGEQVRLERESPLLVELVRDLRIPAIQ
jgi:peptidoglycan hydrolase-like protein with peptidoglycan-binding domain